jgi:regulator of protease activity HflC (stomatin/prohibitin superfamily)
MYLPLLIVVLVVALFLFNWIKILNEYERGVIFRLGRVLDKPKGPGIILVFWPIDRMVRVSLRLIALDVPPQDVITRDNVSVKVNAVAYFRVMEPSRSVIEVENYLFATSQMAQTTLRAVIGRSDLDELLAERDKVNHELQTILDRQTDPWGIKVTNVEVKHVDLPTEMQRAIARQAVAERERRAKIINAEGEFQAAQKLVEAATMMEEHPMSLQMRFIQTMSEVASEKNTTTVLPIPIDLFRPFFKAEIKKEEQKP